MKLNSHTSLQVCRAENSGSKRASGLMWVVGEGFSEEVSLKLRMSG
jgi:hypothetical protein